MVTLLAIANFMAALLRISATLIALFKSSLEALLDLRGIPFLLASFGLFFLGLFLIMLGGGLCLHSR